MVIAIIVLGVICLIELGILVYLILSCKKKVAASYKKGGNDLFELILKSGFDKRVADFKEYNKTASKGGIVFIGDSITEQYNIYEFFKGYQVYNRGIGGDTSEGLLTRMKESVFDLKPSIVVLMIGTNDFGIVKDTTPETLAQRIQKVVSLIHDNCPNTKIILESLYPVYEKKNNPKIDKASTSSRTNKQIDQTNKLISKIDGVSYLDVNSQIKDADGDIILEYTVEGLHISAVGYTFITQLIQERINQIQKGD